MSSRDDLIDRCGPSDPGGHRGDGHRAIDARRRWLLQRLAGAAGTITFLGLGSVVGGCEISRVNNVGQSDIPVDVSALTQNNDSLVTNVPGPDGAPILVVRLSVDLFRALSMRCTHMGCTTAPPSGDRIACPCHGSVYALDGAVISGPATVALYAYRTTFDPATRVLTVHVS